MYTVAMQREFVAQHFLVGGDWGPENDWHSHRYRLVLELRGPELDQHGFLIDCEDVDTALDAFEARFRDHTLNEDEAFAGLNPSIEHFARIASDFLTERLDLGPVESLTVTIWEDGRAYATYERL